MAYPTSSLAIVLEDVDRRMLQIKDKAERDNTRLAAGNVYAATIIDEFINFKQQKAALQAAAATPGIVDYARDMKNNQSLDVAAEFNAVIAAIDAVTNWIAANFPVDGSGYLLRETWGASGPVERQFTPAQTAGLRTQLQALAATIS